MSQPSIKDHVGKTLRSGETLGQWLLTYCEHLRNGAAGRGGNDQATLTQSRINSENVKAANGRIDYLVKLGQLIQASEVENVLVEWADYTQREIENFTRALLHELETKHNIQIDDDMVNSFAGPATERIGSYAAKLGERISGSGSDIPATGESGQR